MRLFELKLGEGNRKWFSNLKECINAMSDHENRGVLCEMKIHKVGKEHSKEIVQEVVQILNKIN
jgi:hypothetical protein